MQLRPLNLCAVLANLVFLVVDVDACIAELVRNHQSQVLVDKDARCVLKAEHGSARL